MFKSRPACMSSCALLLLLIVGCGTVRKTAVEPTFFPSPPDPPRLQYLTSFSDAQDIVPNPSSLQTFLFGEGAAQKNELVKPYGIALQGSKLYVCDTVTGKIPVLDLRAATWENFEPADGGKITKPITIAVDERNYRYISEPLRGYVSIYDAEGGYAGTIGHNEGMKPIGVVASKDRIYIADLMQRKVHVYDKQSLSPLFTIPKNPDNETEKLYSPTNLSLGPDGQLYVSDTGAFRIQQYDREGNFIRTYGGHGDSPGQFARNKGIAVDREGRLYAVDAASQVIQIFDAEGNLLLYFGEPGGSKASLVLPADVIIDYENIDLFQRYADKDFKLEYLVFVSNQYGPRKIAVYGFGNKIK